jgi:hypothetical protein
MDNELKELLRRVKGALALEDVLVVDASCHTALAETDWDPFVITFEITSYNPVYIINTLLARRPRFVSNLRAGPSPAGPHYRQLSVDMK